MWREECPPTPRGGLDTWTAGIVRPKDTSNSGRELPSLSLEVEPSFLPGSFEAPGARPGGARRGRGKPRLVFFVLASLILVATSIGEFLESLVALEIRNERARKAGQGGRWDGRVGDVADVSWASHEKGW